MLKDMYFYHSREIIKICYWIQDSIKTASKKAGEFIGNKIADVATKSNDNIIVKQEPVEEIRV